MRVTLFMALSPNGYIARPDGQEDWLSVANWQDFLALAHDADNFIIGRETYEIVKRLYADYNFDDVEVAHKVVVTRNQDYAQPGGYQVVHSPQEAIDYLTQRRATNALLTGGGKLNAEFLRAGLVNQIILNIAPHVIGEGRPVFAQGDYELSLQLEGVKELSEGRVQLAYTVR